MKLVRYIIKRIVGALFVLFGITIITFTLSNLITDPITATYGIHIKPEQRELIKNQFGLNDPLPLQFGRYVWNAIRGDLGNSYRTRTPVMESIIKVLPNTLLLAVAGLMAEILISIPIGILAALKKGSVLDRLILLVTLIGQTLPIFWWGLILLYFFSFTLRWFPLGGSDQPSSIILPALTIGAGGSIFYIRLIRNQALEEINNDYIRTAQAKGLSWQNVINKHVLRNALLPVVTSLGLDLGGFLGGVVVIESVYSWNGMGKLAASAFGNLDLPLVMGTVLVSAVCIVICNLFIDLIYPILDPRIRL